MSEPKFWRMHMHPNRNHGAKAYYTRQCIQRGFIGLSFREDPGDLRDVTNLQKLTNRPGYAQTSQAAYHVICDEMQIGDKVIVLIGKLPFVLVTVASDYIYNLTATADQGIWCTHFRCITDLIYYSDYPANKSTQALHASREFHMHGTIFRVKKPTGNFFLLMQAMVAWGKKSPKRYPTL